MKRPAVFFDRDNTLIVGNEYLGDPARVELVPGAAAAVARARRLGYATVVVSNQSGVARGLFDETAVQAVNQRLDQLLLADDPAAVIDRHEYCPFHPEGTVEKYRKDSELRKPAPGMILQASDKLALDVARSWMIGDAARDIEAGINAGCRTILFSDPTLRASPAAAANGSVKPDYSATSLRQAMDLIEAHPEPAAMRIAPGTTAGTTASDIAIASAFAPAAASSAPAPGEPKPSPQPTATAVTGSPTKPAQASAPKGSSANAGPPPQIKPVADAAKASSAPAAQNMVRVESLLDQILTELRRRDVPDDEFSVSKLLAGVVQVLAIGVLFLGYLYRTETAETFIGILLFAVFLQVMTIALLIMGRQR